MVNERVQIHKGDSSGVFIHEQIATGTVVKVNEKSIRVHVAHIKYLTNGKTMCEYDVDEEARFTFWKSIENRQLYKNSKYGIIEIA